MHRGRFDSRFTITILGISVLFAAVVASSDGRRHLALIGFILGVAMVIGNEWSASWRQQ